MKKTMIALSVFSALSTLSVAQAQVSLFDYAEPTSAYEDAYVYGDLKVNSGNQDQTSYNLNLNLDYERVFSSPSRDIEIDASLNGSASRGGKSTDKSENTYLGNASASVNNYFVPGSNGGFWYGEGTLGLKKDADDPRITRGDLNKVEYNQIAQIVAQESAYKARYGGADYAQIWINEMVKVINASGKANGRLNATGILKIRDVLLDERISTRKSGWLVKGGVGAIVKDYDGDSGKPVLNLGAEYHVPLNNQTQFSNEAAYSSLLDSDDKSYTFNNDMSLTYEVSDRFDTTLSLSKVDDDIDNNGNDDVEKTLNMGVTYRLK
ncbi:MAG: hypothetical protein CR976_02940 [Thiotrichales bacterium]|nr:MAG: hypothetical protein CR976_02940 [Thiotrichales bacterium]